MAYLRLVILREPWSITKESLSAALRIWQNVQPATAPLYHWSSEAEKRCQQRGLSKTLCEPIISDSSSQVTLDNSDPHLANTKGYPSVKPNSFTASL